MEYAARAVDREGRGSDCRQQGRRHPLARRFRIRRPPGRRALQQRGRRHPGQTRCGSKTWASLSGAEQMPMKYLSLCLLFRLRPIGLALRGAFVSLCLTSAYAAGVNPARELVTAYCISCHNERLKTANLALDKADAEQVFNSAETWEKVVVKLRSRTMPPAGVR